MPQIQDWNKYYSPVKLRTIGQDLYRQKKYEEALEAFSAALATTKEPDLILLDNRSATYEKLGDLQAALKDARQIIVLEKCNVKGYLRAGKILQKMERFDLALKIYERGLRLVPANDKDFPLLQTMHNKLAQTLSPPKAVDLFTIFPVEVIEMILDHIAFAQICRCLRVSKAWHKFLTSWPSLWSHLDFSSALRGVRTSTVYTYLAYSKHNVVRASLRGVELQGNSLLGNLLAKCKRFEDLDLYSGGVMGSTLDKALTRGDNLKRIVLRGPVVIQIQTVQQVMKLCPRLVTAEFHHVIDIQGLHFPVWAHDDYPNLLTFSLCYEAHEGHRAQGRTEIATFCPPASNLQKLTVGSRKGDRAEFSSIAERYPCLEVLSISNLSYVDGIRRPRQPLVLPRHLRVLRLINTNNSYIPRADQNPQLLDLSELVVRDTFGGAASVSDLHAFLQWSTPTPDNSERLASPLKVFDVDISPCLYDYEMSQLLALVEHPMLKDLKELGLSGCETIGDQVAEHISGKFKLLQVLDLSGTKVTGVGVKSIVQCSPCLKELHLDDCFDVGADAIEWARSQVQMVQHRLSTTGSRGRTARARRLMPFI